MRYVRMELMLKPVKKNALEHWSPAFSQMGTVFTEELKLGPVKSNSFILRRGGAEEKIPLVWLVMCFGFVIVFGRLEIGFGNQLLHPHVEVWALSVCLWCLFRPDFFFGRSFLGARCCQYW